MCLYAKLRTHIYYVMQPLKARVSCTGLLGWVGMSPERASHNSETPQEKGNALIPMGMSMFRPAPEKVSIFASRMLAFSRMRATPRNIGRISGHCD